jgi:uncharacterized RDD family membrane protein YckC
MQASGSSVASAPKAGFWIRFVALVIDGLIVGIPGGIVVGILAAVAGKDATGVIIVLYGLFILAEIAYFVYFWSRPDGQTLGMKVFNLRVVKTDGSPLTVGGAIVRYVGYIVDSIIFGLPIGYLWAAFDKDKQAWHDKMAGTYVIKSS